MLDRPRNPAEAAGIRACEVRIWVFPAPGKSFPALGKSFPTPGKSFPTLGKSFPKPGKSFPAPGKSFPTLGKSFPTRVERLDLCVGWGRGMVADGVAEAVRRRCAGNSVGSGQHDFPSQVHGPPCHDGSSGSCHINAGFQTLPQVEVVRADMEPVFGALVDVKAAAEGPLRGGSGRCAAGMAGFSLAVKITARGCENRRGGSRVR